MYKIIVILFPIFLLSSSLKITGTDVINGNLVVVFNKNINIGDFSKHKIEDGIFYDIEAELTLARQDIKMGNNNYVTVAQNSKKTSRIVLETKNVDSINFIIDNNKLNINFNKNNKLNNPNKDINPIIGLFNSIGSNVPSKQIQPTKENIINKRE